MSKDLLLEIGTEEIPAGFMNHTFKQLEDLADELFTNNRIEIGKAKATGTPRRLVLYIEDAVAEQADLKKDVRGPAKSIAFDDEGNPTRAGEGFARGQGITPEELEIRDTDNGEYVFASTVETGQPTKDLLPELLEELIRTLNFPKAMRWAAQELRFVRPIKWILSLYGDEVIDFSLADVKSGKWSRGHRFLSEGKVKLESAEDYFAKLEEAGVIVDHNRRRRMIREQIDRIEEEQDVNVIVDEDLLREVNFLVEYPTALCGSFSEEFLELPSQVLITSMREHQRYFPVEDKTGNLKNLFVTVRNGKKEHLDIVRAGNEKVLQARLSDAIFFYQEDQKSTLEAKVEKLKNIIFQEDLGTIYEKVERLMELAVSFANFFALSEDDVKRAQRAAELAKADLVTEMVNEFAKLQGLMGEKYALIDGEDKEVAQAIFEHYLPRYANDQLPATQIGRIVSIADKIDNIVGCFSVGIIPTGSQDPYALRRQAQGIIKIIVDAGLDIKLDFLIDEALKRIDSQDKLDRTKLEVKEEVLEFFKLRLENLLEEAEIRYDVIDAVLAGDYTDVNDTLLKAAAVMEFREEANFAELITAFNRVTNLAQGDNMTVNSELFTDDSEDRLYKAYQKINNKVKDLMDKEYYTKALKEVAKLKDPVDNFFDSVMVMVDNKDVKNNRLGLLNKVAELLSQIADLTKIVID